MHKTKTPDLIFGSLGKEDCADLFCKRGSNVDKQRHNKDHAPLRFAQLPVCYTYARANLKKQLYILGILGRDAYSLRVIGIADLKRVCGNDRSADVERESEAI